MIDFSDPKTDVQDMYEDFKKYSYNKYNKDGRFDVIGLANWINRKYHSYADDLLMDDAKTLVSVWLSCGLIRNNNLTRLQTRDFRVYNFNE
jgi:hypothetical protein